MCSNKSRAYCLTIFSEFMNELVENLEKQIECQQMRYFVIGKETCPTTKKKHLQCYFYYPNPLSFNSIKKRFPEAHIEPAKGTPTQASEYCKKEGDYEERGELPKQGQRTDIDIVREQIKEGAGMKGVVSVATILSTIDTPYCLYKLALLARSISAKESLQRFEGPSGVSNLHTHSYISKFIGIFELLVKYNSA